MSEKVTAGSDFLGDIAPKFAEMNDDVLFGQIWSREQELSPKIRSMITVAGLMGAGILDESLRGHLEKALENGVKKEELVEIITHLAFYTGWAKAWSAFYMLKGILEKYTGESSCQSCSLFGLGNELKEKSHFNGKVYVNEIYGLDKPVLVDNVTFEPGCRNNWHIHQAGQTLLVTDGRGWYQEEGKEAKELRPGDIVEIPGGVKHWHGAVKDSWFSHLAFEDPAKGAPEWCEAVSDEEYGKLQ